MSLLVGRGPGTQPLERGQETLEALLFKATNPSNKIEDVNTIKLFCDQIEKIQDGPILAGRLLSHKIQSPQEGEALQALAVVEAATKASQGFVAEVGKFRFLNEMIKLISPKYLGTRTPESVKQRVIELLYSWTRNFPQEKKITEAYAMLKGQGVIKADPVHVKEAVFATSLKPREADLSEEDSRKLQKLLHSGCPQDLEKANKIIQGMVKKEEEKLEKATRQASQLQEIQSSTRLLSDMLERSRDGEVGEGDREIMSDLYKACEGWRPKLFRLAAEAEENDPSIGDILYAGDEISRVMDDYKNIIILNKYDRASQRVTSSDLCDLTPRAQQPCDPFEQFLRTNSGSTAGAAGPPASGATNFCPLVSSVIGATSLSQLTAPSSNGSILDTASDQSSMLGLEDNPSVEGLDDVISLQRLQPSVEMKPDYTAELLSGLGLNSSSTIVPSSNPLVDLLSDEPLENRPDATSILIADSSVDRELNKFDNSIIQTRRKGLDELDMLGEKALTEQLPGNLAADFVARKQGRLPMKELMRQQSTASEGKAGLVAQPTETRNEEKASTDQTSGAREPRVNHVEPVPSETKLAECKLSDISVKMDDVVPHPKLTPVKLLEAVDGVSAVLHPTTNQPKPGVSVFVLQLTNLTKQQVEELDFKAAVPKGCKVRMVKPCSTSLPPAAPFTPPPTATQLMLVFNPGDNAINMSFVLSYSIDDEPCTHIGKDIELPKTN